MIRAALVLAVLAGPALADERGAAIFADHCAVCHGADARGDGPTSTWLIRKPADLTQLAAGNGGTFPTLRILTRIDGRDPFLDRRVAMPVYGNVLGGPLVPMTIETGQEVTVPEDLAAVVAWLQGVQE